MNYLGRKELRAALPELRDLFMRRFLSNECTGPRPKGQQEFLEEEWARSRKDGKLCDRICKRTTSPLGTGQSNHHLLLAQNPPFRCQT